MWFFDTPGTPGGGSIVERMFFESKQPLWFSTNAEFSNLILKLANKGGVEIINKIITNMSGFCAILGPNEMGVTCSNKSTMFLQKNFPFLSSMSEPNYVSYPLCHETLWKIIKFRQSSFDSSSKKEIIYPFRFADPDKNYNDGPFNNNVNNMRREGGQKCLFLSTLRV